MKTDTFAPDCASCAALCCLALDFDKGDSFAFSKPAGLPCRNLAGHCCSIHAGLADRGFSGCAAYTCLGAGQIVSQQLFAGRSWRDDPGLALPMIDAFSRMRQIRDLAAQLSAAAALPLPPALRAEVETLLLRLTPPRWSAESLAAFDLPAARAAFARLLAAMRTALASSAPRDNLAAIGDRDD